MRMNKWSISQKKLLTKIDCKVMNNSISILVISIFVKLTSDPYVILVFIQLVLDISTIS